MHIDYKVLNTYCSVNIDNCFSFLGSLILLLNARKSLAKPIDMKHAIPFMNYKHTGWKALRRKLGDTLLPSVATFASWFPADRSSMTSPFSNVLMLLECFPSSASDVILFFFLDFFFNSASC